MNTSQTDLIYKSSWDDMARQLFNAGRIIRSLTKLKYSVGSEEFAKKMHKIQFVKRFEQMQQRCEYVGVLPGEYGDGVSVTRKDY